MPYRDDRGGDRLSGAATRFDRWGTRRGNPYAADPRWDEPDPGAPGPRHPDDALGAAPADAGAAWEPGPRARYGDDTGYGGGFGADDGFDPDDGPPEWPTADGAYLSLPYPVWMRWRPRPWPRPWPPRGPRRPPGGRRGPRALDRLGRLIGGARRIGTVRHRPTGARYPAYRARLGGRSWRIVARPPLGGAFRGGGRGGRGGLRGEIGEILEIRPEGVLEAHGAGEMEAYAPGASAAWGREMEMFPLHASAGRELEMEAYPPDSSLRELEMFPLHAAASAREREAAPLEREAFPLSASPEGRAGAAAGRAGAVTEDGVRLRLPHTGLHAVLSRMQPDQLRGLAGGDLPADPAPAVVRGLGRVVRRARRARPGRTARRGRRGGRAELEVFEAPGYELLVRSLGPAEGEILGVRATE